MSARDAILGRIRERKKGADRSAEEIDRLAADLIKDPGSYRLDLSDRTPLELFVEKATSERLTATVEHLPAVDFVPASVKTYLQDKGLPLSVTLSKAPAFSGLDWSGIDTHFDIAPSENVAVSFGLWGIAETGTVIFESSPQAPVLHGFLPLHHLIVLPVNRIVSYFEDYWAARAETGAPLPRSINWITGTSGTADIEARNVRGAHGPRFMHMLLIGSP